MRRVVRFLAGAYGVVASGLLLAIALLGDRTAVTYAAGLMAFWWLLPVPAVVLVLLLTLLRRRSAPRAPGARRRRAGRRWGFPAASVSLLLPLLATVWLLGPYALPGRASEAPADLTVGAFNTSGRSGLRALHDISTGPDRPDVWLLQEVTIYSREILEERIGSLYPYREYSENATESDGSAVLSTHPIVSVQPVTGLPTGSRGADLVTLDVDGRDLAVVSVHLASPCLGCVGEAAEQNPAGSTASAARVRIAEARRYAELARQLQAQGRPLVIGGDLNSSDLNQPLRILTGGVLDTGPGDGGLVDTHRAVGTRPQLTRGQNPGFARVDVLLVAGLEPLRDTEGWAARSTHSPVLGWFAWP